MGEKNLLEMFVDCDKIVSKKIKMAKLSLSITEIGPEAMIIA